MSSTKPIPLIVTSTFLFSLIFLHAATALNPLFHFCFNKENFASNSTFATNLNELLNNSLPTKVPPTGFGISSIGQGGCNCEKSQAYGLGLCRGGVSTQNCKTCIVEAAKELQQRCPYKKGAIIWYESCLLKYSDEEFFGQIDNSNKFYLSNGYQAKDPKSFIPKVNELLRTLSKEASTASGFYATGERDLGEGPDSKLYGLAQCTRDLKGVDCKKCLDNAISEFQNCCSGQRGVRVYGGSCYIRFELYPVTV